MRMPACAKSAVAIVVVALAGSCAPAPPPLMVSDGIWSPHHTGYIFRTAYYTEAELADPRWERGRREMRQATRQCDPARERVVRRDVRWYPATPESGARCAALVYTVECGTENRYVSAPAAEIRRRILATEPQRAIGPGCGDKDYYYHHPEDCARQRFRPAGCQVHIQEGTLRPIE